MSKAVLVLNAGSSSLKYALYDLAKGATCISQGIVDGIGTERSFIAHKNLLTSQDVKLQGPDIRHHKQGLQKVLELLRVGEGSGQNVTAVGHRVVHGGEALTQPTLVTESVKQAIERAIPLAPLHNPPNLEGIRVAEELFECPQVAVFDTAFHSTIPPSAYHYAIPYKLYEELGIRKYGMHGTSYQYLLGRAAHMLGKPQKDVNIIALHLGAGASMAAIKDGKCIDTSMGVTPLQGLVMATRSGDIDPAIIQMLAAEKGMNIDEITNMLNKKSGLFGLCGEKDMRSVWDAAEAGSARHKLALEVYVHRIRTYLGAYFFHLQGRVDALVFSAGVGEASGRTRALICEGLEKFGIEIDPSQNGEGKLKEAKAIHKNGSKVQILVIPTDEELSIAQQTLQVVNAHQQHMKQ
ncbi:hypothetical protein M758_9G027300 [Ceratodon purpureus]|nr:hypothetical protein M758_9G027300 [Ceratodon purpureus]